MRYFEFLNCPLETFSGTGANRFLKGLLRLLGVFLFQNLPQKARKNKQGFPGRRYLPLTTSAYTLVFSCNAEEQETERRQRLRVPV